MAYTPDEITLNEYPKNHYNTDGRDELTKTPKYPKNELRKKLLNIFYIFIGFIIGLLPTILILKN